MLKMANKNHLLLLFDRPREPCFMSMLKKNFVFDIPENYLVDKYKTAASQIVNNFNKETCEKIYVSEIYNLPQLGEILDLKRNENFSLFIPKHSRIAGQLIEIFLGMCNLDELFSFAVYARDRVNPYLFHYCLSVALLHRPDIQGIDLPSLASSFPDKYLDSQVLGAVREEATILPDGLRTPFVIPMACTASDLEVEHKVAYFREDLGINLHHWHWHLVYPNKGPRDVVDKDRRGELFYYMHQQIIARYNFERLCNDMNRVERLVELKEPIREAYFPKLNIGNSCRAFSSRVENQTLSNLSRAEQFVDVDDLIRWRDRIMDAIHSGFVHDAQGNQITLTENEGIDILGNIVEASNLSLNSDFYGNIHNSGHNMIAYIHDPDNRHLESSGVMGDTSTAMRDPIFYRWHAFIDYMFQEHKNTLPTYTEQQLGFDGVTVQDIEIQALEGENNQINTFWQQSDVDISRGMNFKEEGSIPVRFTHLQHRDFNYKITVNNTGANRQGTCRIFIAPKNDERDRSWSFREQKNMMIELDKFTVNLKNGENTITRRSTDSSVTIPFERTFRNLDKGRPAGEEELAEFNFCGCGWPQHMLIPKGRPEGYPCELFVMISDYEGDRVDQSTEGACNSCDDAGSYCGIKDKLYPDRRSMGYPFDRLPRQGVDTLQEFLTGNMRVQNVNIQFES